MWRHSCRIILQNFWQHFFHDAYFVEVLQITIFVQKKPFFTCNDLVYMTTNTEVAESLIFQCRYNDVTFTLLTLPSEALFLREPKNIHFVLYKMWSLPLQEAQARQS
jgi:hypothetical protein